MRNGGPLSLRRGSEAARLLALRVRVPPHDMDDCDMTVVFRHVDVLATDRSLVQGSPTECGVVCLCVCVCVCARACEASIMKRPWSARGLLRHEKERRRKERKKEIMALFWPRHVVSHH